MSGNSLNCDCHFCKHSHEFELIPELLSDFLEGRVVLFAGAGISTESKAVLNVTLYDQLAAELSEKPGDLLFPDLVEKFCNNPNGRYKFLKAIADRFACIESFPELRTFATRFHQELATFHPIHTIVTTNWDTYFEDCCDAVPFVSDDDLAFWDDVERRVLKIHGSITNYGSIIASRSDYDKRTIELETEIIGSRLKVLLATKTVVFVGYSFSDSDFNQIYKFVGQRMRGLQRQAYIVTPYEDEAKQFRELGLIPIVTDGTFFVSQIKQHAIEMGLMPSDDVYIIADTWLELMRGLHNELAEQINLRDFPQIIYALSYQDGYKHALERVVERRTSGEYSDKGRTAKIIKLYWSIKKDKLKGKHYQDVAYVEGYINALRLVFFDDGDHENIPLYFAFGIPEGLMSLEDFRAALPSLPEKHKTSYKSACKYVKSLRAPDDVIYHHPPWL